VKAVVAAVPAGAFLMDREAALDKTEGLVKEAATQGANLVVRVTPLLTRHDAGMGNQAWLVSDRRGRSTSGCTQPGLLVLLGT
jgi:hypothetical protein